MDEALEYYLNFHLESYQNDSQQLDEIIQGITKDLEVHKDNDGAIRVRPGCFVYEISKTPDDGDRLHLGEEK